MSFLILEVAYNEFLSFLIKSLGLYFCSKWFNEIDSLEVECLYSYKSEVKYLIYIFLHSGFQGEENVCPQIMKKFLVTNSERVAYKFLAAVLEMELSQDIHDLCFAELLTQCSFL